jgi:glycosyltransferase involved in cell wall biosynthesis
VVVKHFGRSYSAGCSYLEILAEMHLSVVIPIYNERDSIASLAANLLAVLDRLPKVSEVIFANDGSSDGSTEILDEIAESDERVRVVHLRRNYGQTAALMAAIQYSSGAVIVPLDGDGQNDPADIPRLLARLEEGYDVVSGWRKQREDGALQRRLPSVAANWLISRLLGVPLHDYGCTLKAYRRDVIEDVRLYGEMHRFIPIYAAWEGARVTELEVTHYPRRFGRSKYGLSRIGRVVLDLLMLYFKACRCCGPSDEAKSCKYDDWLATHRSTQCRMEQRFREGQRWTSRKQRQQGDHGQYG